MNNIETFLNEKTSIRKVLQNKTVKEVESFAENITKAASGGYYTFFCPKCHLTASFSSKKEKKLFEKFHKEFGCDGYIDPTSGTYKFKKAIIPNAFLKFIELMKYKEKIEKDESSNKEQEIKNEEFTEETDEQIKRNMPEEFETT